MLIYISIVQWDLAQILNIFKLILIKKTLHFIIQFNQHKARVIW